jgi:hypothetical protein
MPYVSNGFTVKRNALRRYWLALCAAGSVVLLYPFKTTVVPMWRFQVVNEAGDPLPVVQVRQVWQHYTVETSSHEEESVTDENGYVTFPERTVRASILQRVLGFIVKLPAFIHASWGPHSYVIVLAGPDYLNLGSYDGDGPLPERIEVWRMKDSPAGQTK